MRNVLTGNRRVARAVVCGVALAAIAFFPGAVPAGAATNELTSILQKGLFEEEANRNLDAAIAAYQSLVTQFDKDRQVAATAAFRLGECYRKLGKTNEAAVQYQRIIREFSDQNTLATLSRQNLAGMGLPAPTSTALSSSAARQEQRNLLEKQIQLSEQDVAEARKKFESGLVPQTEVRSAEREVLRLKQELAALDARGPELLSLAPDAGGSSTPDILQSQYALLKTQIDEARKETNYANLYKLFNDEDLRQALIELWTAEQYGPPMGTNYPGYREHKDNVEAARRRLFDFQERRLAILQSAIQQARAAQSTQTAGGQSEAASVTDEEEKEIRRIKSMIQNSPDLVNAPDNDHRTPLQRAAAAGQLRVAQYLLDTHANLETTDRYGNTALTLAAAAGHKAMVELLLNRGADVNAAFNQGQTALHKAAFSGFTAVAEVLLAHKADVNAAASDGVTPLQIAASRGDLNFVKLLLANGADVNVKDRGGATSLHSAASAGQTAIIRLLLEAKANINARNNSGETPLLLATKNGKADAAKELLAAGADPKLATAGDNNNHISPLHWAVAAGDETLTRDLLERGTDPNLVATPRPIATASGGSFQSGSPGPPLFTACDKNNPALVKILLEHGADPNMRYGDAKQTPLLLYAWWKPEVLKVLLEHKADPNLADTEGKTALHSVAESDGGSTNAIALLVEHGANVNARMINGSTPLHVAVWNDHPQIMAALLAFKADPNLRNGEGNTPLDLTKGSRLANVRSYPLRIPPPGGVTTVPNAESSAPVDVTSLLREHGALDNLPHFDRIELTRPGIRSDVPFAKGINDWNRFTLLEVIAENYGLIGTQRMGEAHAIPGNLDISQSDTVWPGDALRFPDFKAVVIHRPSADGKTWKNVPVNVAEILSSGDCSRDVWLQWGDVIEIPEADHPVSEHWLGPAEPEWNALIKCVSRTVTISINNTNVSFSVAPALVTAPRMRTLEFYGHLLSSGQVGRRSVSCMVRSVLDQSKLVRFSSDLSRVKVSRRDAASGKSQSWVVDCTGGNNAPDLWLRDGDVVQVPEK
jgi:ankyrin repeat protein